MLHGTDFFNTLHNMNPLFWFYIKSRLFILRNFLEINIELRNNMSKYILIHYAFNGKLNL